VRNFDIGVDLKIRSVACSIHWNIQLELHVLKSQDGVFAVGVQYPKPRPKTIGHVSRKRGMFNRQRT
jgi:hypothetical protein